MTFTCQIDILIHYIFWKHISFCKWNENFSVKLLHFWTYITIEFANYSVPCTLLFVT